ncbi:hypothetical protein HMI55_004441, partial [Coelomomyces lativittatus]
FADIVYISDCSKIPQKTVSKLQNTEVIILDALRPEIHKSHFSILECMQTLFELQPTLGIMTGFTHQLTHNKLVAIGSAYAKSGKNILEEIYCDSVSNELEMNCTSELSFESKMNKLLDIIPAFDGMRIPIPLEIDSISDL